MLRGKFGQIGNHLRDGHITMDAFQQAAFRDHIRSGERIMFLASMGKLKHKRTRNTIAAEPTPRSSCPSTDSPTAHANAAAPPDPAPIEGHIGNSNTQVASDPLCQEVTQAERMGKGGGGSEYKLLKTEAAGRDRGDTGTSSPRSQRNHLLSNADRRASDPDRNDCSGKANDDDPPDARRFGAGAAASSTHLGLSSKPEDRTQEGSGAPTSHRQFDRSRPRSAGPGGYRPQPGSARRRPPGGGITTNAERAPINVPLHVGPPITATSDLAAPRSRGEPRAGGRARPASAGGGGLAGTSRWTAQQNPTKVVHRGFGIRGVGRGGAVSGRGGGGGCGGRGQKGGRALNQTSNSSSGRTSSAEGSFAVSVINSARAFADDDDGRGGVRTRTERPKSASAAAATAAAAAIFDPDSAEPSAALAADTRFMPVGEIDKAFKGRRLAALQAWDPQAAAAVRAARAEKLLRRALIGRAGPTGAPMPAAAPATRRPRAMGSEAGQQRARVSSAGRGRLQDCGISHGDVSEAGDWCGNRGLRKDCRRELARRELARSVSAIERVGGNHYANGQGAPPRWTPGNSGGSTTLESKGQKGKGRGMLERDSSCSGSARDSGRHSEICSDRVSTGFTRSGSAAMSTARTSTATTYSSRGSNPSTSRRSASTTDGSSRSACGSDGSGEARRTRLLLELETLRKRMEDAEGLLREVDKSLLPRPKRRPRATARRGTAKSSEKHSSSGRGTSSVATAGNTSAKSSAGYGAFNLGECRMCPVVVTHQANAFVDEL